MHLEVYRQRPEVQAVVHAHPPIATGFAVAGIPLDRAVLAEVVTTLGSVPIAEYATPSTRELPESVRKYVKAHDGMLLANHGALTMGPDVFARLLQDGDDRALREDQSRGAHARRRTPAVARGSGAAREAARLVRHRLAGADLRRIRAPERRRLTVRSCSRRSSTPGERLVSDRVSGGVAAAAARWRRRPGSGNSANIQRTHGTDRGRGQKLSSSPRRLWRQQDG